MNFDFSDDLKQLRDQARRFLSEQCPPAVVRRSLDGQETYAADLWRAIAEMGWIGAAIPEEFGGAGLGYEGLCVLAEEMGRAVAPVPFGSTAYLAAEAILTAGSDAQRREYLPKLADGSLIGCLAMSEGNGNPEPSTIHARVVGGRLTGAKWPVADGGIADIAVVVACDEHRQPGLFIVDLPDVRRRDLKTLDPTRNHARLEFDATPVQTLVPAAGVRCSGCWTGQQSCSRSSRSAALMPACRWRGITRRNVLPSAGRSVRSRRSSTSWRTSTWRWSLRGRTPITVPGRWGRTPPTCRWPRRRLGCPRPRRSIWRRRKISRPMAASASPGRWTAICSIADRNSSASAIGSAPFWKDRLVDLLETRNAA